MTLHPLTGWACLLTLILLWAPGGLIHRGQQAVNPEAPPIVACGLSLEVCK